MNYIECNSVDEIQKKVINDLLKNGGICSPRGLEIKELCGYCIRLNNPRRRLIYNPERKFSLTFAIGEFLWYWGKRNDLEMIKYYNKSYDTYSDDGKTLNGAYGKRIFGQTSGQFEKIVQKLKEDKDTRQAVISIYKEEDVFCRSKDIPCTCTIQFLIRENQLNCIVYMRSNDIIWGMAYDIFSFTMIQEILATILGVKIGWYEHHVGSLHIYNNFYELGEKMVERQEFEEYEMPTMPLNSKEELDSLVINEERLRKNLSISNYLNTVYFKQLESILEYLQAKKKGEIERREQIKYNLPDMYGILLR